MSEFTSPDPYTNDVLYRLVEVANDLQSFTIKRGVPREYQVAFAEHLKSVREGMRELNRLSKKLHKIHEFTAVDETQSRSLQDLAAARRKTA